MVREQYKYADLTEKIIGAAMKVHRWFGPGFPEIIYQRSLIIELRKAGLACEAEVERTVYYENEVVGKRRLDIIVEEKILVENKAMSELDAAALNKTLNYLKIFNLEVGLLLNFGALSLQWNRFVR